MGYLREGLRIQNSWGGGQSGSRGSCLRDVCGGNRHESAKTRVTEHNANNECVATVLDQSWTTCI